jgi:HlyD family secretion protein
VLVLSALAVAGGLGYFAWVYLRPARLPEGFASSNGRIEATEIDIATKIAERLAAEMVNEGDFVKEGQPLAQMNTEVLSAQLREAEANQLSARISVDTARNVITQKVSEKAAAEATVSQREAELSRDSHNYDRGKRLRASGSSAISEEELDGRRASFFATQAALETAKANVAAADAAISTAKTLLIMAESNVVASAAKIASRRTSRTARCGRRGTAACSTASPRSARCCKRAARCSTWWT